MIATLAFNELIQFKIFNHFFFFFFFPQLLRWLISKSSVTEIFLKQEYVEKHLMVTLSNYIHTDFPGILIIQPT